MPRAGYRFYGAKRVHRRFLTPWPSPRVCSANRRPRKRRQDRRTPRKSATAPRRRLGRRHIGALRIVVHAEAKNRAVQSVPVPPAEPLAWHRRPPTPHPSVSMDARNAISHALFHEGKRQSELNENLRREAGAAGRGDKTNAQEFGLHAGDGARFARSGAAGVNLLIFRVDIRHGALQNNAHRGWRGAEDGLPAHGCAGIVRSGKAGQRKLRPGGGAAGEGFVVEAEANVAGKERARRRRILIRGHGNSLGKFFSCQLLVLSFGKHSDTARPDQSAPASLVVSFCFLVSEKHPGA